MEMMTTPFATPLDALRAAAATHGAREALVFPHQDRRLSFAAWLTEAEALARGLLALGLKPGAHVDLVGAFNLHMREADDAALQRARLFVDTPAALSEGGDVALGLRAGVIAPDRIEGDLFSLCRGEATGRAGADEITLFKSVGTALEDLVAAMLVWKRLRGEA